MRVSMLRRCVVVSQKTTGSSRHVVSSGARSLSSFGTPKDDWDDQDDEPIAEKPREQGASRVDPKGRSSGLAALDKLIMDLKKRGVEKSIQTRPDEEDDDVPEDSELSERGGGPSGDLQQWRERTRAGGRRERVIDDAPSSRRRDDDWDDEPRQRWAAEERDVRPPVTVGRSHRLSVESLPPETTEVDLEGVLEEIALARPVSVEFFYGRADVKNALVEFETREVLERVLTPSRLQFGVYVRAQRCPIHDAMTRVTQLFVARVPSSMSKWEIEQ
jgi:hypothetical protein